MYVCMYVRELLLDHWADLLHICGKDASYTRLTYKLYLMTLNERSRSTESSKFDLFVYASWKVLKGSNIFHCCVSQVYRPSTKAFTPRLRPKNWSCVRPHCNYKGNRMQLVFLGHSPVVTAWADVRPISIRRSCRRLDIGQTSARVALFPVYLPSPKKNKNI